MSDATTSAAAPVSPVATSPPAASAAPKTDQKAAETKTEAPKAPEQKPEPRADSWAKLAQGEKRIKEDGARLKAEREAWEAEKKSAIEAASKSALAAYRERIAKGEYDEALAEIGVDYVAWSKARIAKMGKQQPAIQGPPDVKKLVAEELAKRDEEAKKAAEAASSQAWSKAWSTFQDTVKSTASTNELLALELADNPGTVEQTLRIIASQAPHLTFEQAAERYEAYLVDRTKKLLQTSKVRALYVPPPAEAAKPAETVSPRAGTGQKADEGGPRTLTNALAAEPSSHREEVVSGKSRTAQIRAEREEARRREGRAVGRLNQG